MGGTYFYKSLIKYLIMNKKPLIYFGHPVNFYNTDKEEELVAIIEEEMPGYDIENPNQPKHQEGYQSFKREKGNGMKYYFEEVLPDMDAGIFLSFEDKMFGAGVYGEAENIFHQGKPIFEITTKGSINPMTLDRSRFLSIEDTRKRVYGKK